jgi:hypothetical protein
MSFRFSADDLVVNMNAGVTQLTQGRVYKVIDSYEDDRGQEWTRVADNDGDVVGWDPERFIHYEGDEGDEIEDQERALENLFGARARMMEVLAAIPAGREYSSCKEAIADIENVIAIFAIVVGERE